MSHSGFHLERWRHINLLLLLLFKELFVVLGWLIFGTLASFGGISKLFICPSVITCTMLWGTVTVGSLESSVLSWSTIRTLLNFKISSNLGLYKFISLGRLPHILLIISMFFDIMYGFLEYVWTGKFSDLPLIETFLLKLLYLVIVLTLRLGFQFGPFMCI